MIFLTLTNKPMRLPNGPCLLKTPRGGWIDQVETHLSDFTSFQKHLVGAGNDIHHVHLCEGGLSALINGRSIGCCSWQQGWLWKGRRARNRGIIRRVYPYTEYAGWALTASIPVNFSNAHGKSWQEVGSTERIWERRGYPGPPNFSVVLTKILSPLLTCCGQNTTFSRLLFFRLHHNLPHSSGKTSLVP